MELILGGAQFGFSYGATNRSGQVDRQEVGRILAYAQEHGIKRIDTAAVYGESESVLGNYLATMRFRVISKLPRLSDPSPADIGHWAEQSVRASLARLRCDQLDALLLHHPPDLEGGHGEALYEAICRVRELGLTRRLGFSVYDPETFIRIASKFPVQVVQLPLNVFDQRFVSEAIPWARERGIEIHARSLFLQGTLLASPANLPTYLQGFRPVFSRLHDWCQSLGASPLEVVLAFAKSMDAVDGWVVGVTGMEELAQILRAWNQVLPSDADFKQWASLDEELILPSKWKKKKSP